MEDPDDPEPLAHGGLSPGGGFLFVREACALAGRLFLAELPRSASLDGIGRQADFLAASGRLDPSSTRAFRLSGGAAA
jgi:hypothetical protein